MTEVLASLEQRLLDRSVAGVGVIGHMGQRRARILLLIPVEALQQGTAGCVLNEAAFAATGAGDRR